MNWTAILARAGIPEPPGRAEVLEVLRRRQEAKREALAAEVAAAIQRHQERLAAQGDRRKAIRSKVRVGAG